MSDRQESAHGRVLKTACSWSVEWQNLHAAPLKQVSPFMNEHISGTTGLCFSRSEFSVSGWLLPPTGSGSGGGSRRSLSAL
jgi:hypothetical protein